MEVKEAIEWVKYLDGLSARKDKNRNTKAVISLLQRGEKYKKMWGEMKVYFSPPAFRYPIEKLEQKYLKEANPNEADNK